MEFRANHLVKDYVLLDDLVPDDLIPDHLVLVVRYYSFNHFYSGTCLNTGSVAVSLCGRKCA